MSDIERQDLELVDYLCAAQNRPGDIAARMALVGAFQRSGQTDRALDELDSMEGQFPDDPQVSLARAKILALESRWTEAVAAYHAAIEAGGRTAEVYHGLGLAHLNAAQRDDAKRSFSAAVTLNHRSVESLLCLTSILFDEGEHAKIIALLEGLLNLHGENPRLLHVLAAACAKTGEPLKATLYIQEGLRHAPGDRALLVLRAEILLQNNDFARAAEEYDALINTFGPDPVFLTNRGLTHEMAGRRAEALADYDAALELDPRNPIALTNRGMFHAAAGRIGKALADLGAALELRPGDPVLLHNIAVAHLKKNDYRTARACLKKAAARKHEPSKELLRKIDAQ